MTVSVKITADMHLNHALGTLSKLPQNQNGQILWDTVKLDEGTFEIIYSLRFTPFVEDHVKDAAVWHVLNECARANDFSNRFFIRRLRHYIAAHLSKEPRAFLAACQVNCSPTINLPKKIPYVSGIAEFRQFLSKQDGIIIDSLGDYERDRLGLCDRFTYLTSQIRATNDRAGVDLAYKNIKYCLGVLNLVYRGFGVSKRFGIPHAPLGKFLSASPIFLVDRKRRELGGYLSECHYPTAYRDNFSVWHQVDSGPALQKALRHYVTDMARIDFSDKIVQSIILLQEGLETNHIDVALLKFWTGIELLCAKETREAAEKVVERASSIFNNPRHAAMRLNFIQEFRNKIVHKGEAGDHSILCAQWGSLYLGGVINFFLFNKYKLRNHAHILEYLSAPLDRRKLTETMGFYRTRLNSMKGKQL